MSLTEQGLQQKDEVLNLVFQVEILKSRNSQIVEILKSANSPIVKILKSQLAAQSTMGWL